jgi:hypothetical protein
VVGAAEAGGLEVNEYSVGPLYPDGVDGRGRHAFVVEFRGEGIDDARLAGFA